MESQGIIEHIMNFGLTRQEASIYMCLVRAGKLTGYEVAKTTGISRSNAYGSLASLVEKGGAYVLEEAAKKYLHVPLQEFCDNYIRNLEVEKRWIENHMPCRKSGEDGYITIEGTHNILNKIKNMLREAKERVYVSCSKANLIYLEAELKQLAADGKKVVVLTDAQYELPNSTIYTTDSKGCQIGVIVDSSYVLTGEYITGGFRDEDMSTCLYSGQKNFVELFKTALANEIKLIGYTKGEL